jgi:hypothetical protein
MAVPNDLITNQQVMQYYNSNAIQNPAVLQSLSLQKAHTYCIHNQGQYKLSYHKAASCANPSNKVTDYAKSSYSSNLSKTNHGGTITQQQVKRNH